MAQRQRSTKRSAADTARPAPQRPAVKKARKAGQPPSDPSPTAAAPSCPTRCPWAESVKGPLRDAYIAYHDEEWGVPKYDDTALFELLTLEAAQAGLSWSTILRKREAYRMVFADFDAAAVAAFDADAAVQRLMAESSGIVRHEAKIRSAINNARCFIKIQEEHGSFSAWAWGFVGGKPIDRGWTAQADVPSKTKESEALSAALRQNGFTFVGPTTCYAFMQAVGMVNDHLVGCDCYQRSKDAVR